MKSVLVTGGAKGIGRIIVDALEVDGWQAWTCGRAPAAAVDLSTYLQIDLAIPGRAIELMAIFHKAPDAIVCNAGDYGALGPLVDVDLTAWRRSFDLNLFAVVETVQSYLRLVRQKPPAGRPKIVLVGGAGIGGPKAMRGISAYSCAKAALCDLAAQVAFEEPGTDINVLAPGAVETSITEQARRAGIVPRQAAEDAPGYIGRAIVRLLSQEFDGVSGRLLSVRRDGRYMDRAKTLRTDPVLLTLRRIDGELFTRG